jgi:hypothetical protein
MWINSPEDCYKILGVKPGLKFSKIEHTFQKEALKYHKFRKVHDSYRKYFIALVLAFECLKYIREYKQSGIGKHLSQKEIFEKWQENKYAITMDLATKYLQLKPIELEGNFYRGFLLVRKVIYSLLLILAVTAMAIAYFALWEDDNPLFVLFLYALILIPLVKNPLLYLKQELRISRKLRYIRKIRQGIKYKAKNKKSFDDNDILTRKDKNQKEPPLRKEIKE